MATRISQAAAEVGLKDISANLRISQEAAEVGLKDITTGELRLSKLAVEIGYRIYLLTGSGIPSAEAFGAAGDVNSGSGGQSLSGSAGISSAEAFESEGFLHQSLLEGGGIASAEVFGDGGLVAPEQSLAGSAGIPSSEAFGSAGILALRILGGSGLASSEAFGSEGAQITLEKILLGSGIASAEAFGAGKIAGPIGNAYTDSGIASAEAFGENGALSGHSLASSAGIPSAEAFGADGLLGSIGGPLVGATGIPSAEGLGVGRIAGPVGVAGLDSGIASAEAFGSPGALTTIIRRSQGIPSAEYFSNLGRLSRGVSGLTGIISGEAFGAGGGVLSLSNQHTNFGVFIGGRVVTSYLVLGSLRVDRQLNFQATASLSLLIRDGSDYRPAVGAEIVIYHFSEDAQAWRRIFAGSISDVNGSWFGGVDGNYRYELTCADYAKALSRRIVIMKFPAANYGSLSSIMGWMQSNILFEEGITWVDQGDPGIALPDLEFNAPANEVCDRLAELTGLPWQVDFNRALRFYDRATEVIAAPFDITEETAGPNGRIWKDLIIKRTRGLYRNRQYVKASYSKTTKIIDLTYDFGVNELAPTQILWNASMLVDRRWFYRLVRILEVKLNGVVIPWYLQPQIPGDPYLTPEMPQGGDAVDNWRFAQIWAYDLQLLWNAAFTAPTTGDVLEVKIEIKEDLPSLVMVEDPDEIAATKAAEGGSGIYEAVEEVLDLEDAAAAEDIAQQLLERFGVRGLEAEFTCYKTGLDPGMQLDLDMPSLGASYEGMMVERITYSEDDKRRLIHRGLISNQIQQRDGLTAFQRLIRRMRKNPPRPTQYLTFSLAETIPGLTNPGLQVGAETTAHLIRKNITLTEAGLYFKTPPTGANIRLDIRVNGVSILPSSIAVEYTPDDDGTITFSNFKDAPVTLTRGMIVSIHVLQAGTGQPGKDGTLTLVGLI